MQEDVQTVFAHNVRTFKANKSREAMPFHALISLIADTLHIVVMITQCVCILSIECIKGPKLLSCAHVSNSSDWYLYLTAAESFCNWARDLMHLWVLN